MTTPTPELVALLPCPFCGGEAHLERQGHVACKTGWPCGHTAYMNSGTPAEQNADAITVWNTRAATVPQGVVDQDALDAARNRPDGDWHVSDGPSGYQHRILEAGPAFDRTVCDVKESKDARLLAAAPAMFVALCRLSEYGDMSNDAQYGTLSASMVKGIADAAIDAALTPPPAELGKGDAS